MADRSRRGKVYEEIFEAGERRHPSPPAADFDRDVNVEFGVIDPRCEELGLRTYVSKANASLRWRTSLFFGSYPLAVRTGATEPERASDTDNYEWLSGSETSRPYSLSSLSSIVSSSSLSSSISSSSSFYSL